jgi:hypothetical protein
MGWLDADDNWVSGDKDAADKQLREAAKSYMAEGADRVDRPVEQATSNEADPTKKAARRVFELGRHGGNIEHISTLLAIKRAAAGEQTDPAAIANQNRAAIGEIADDFDDTVEETHAQDDQDDREDFYDWLLDEHNLTEHDLALQCQQLNEQDQDQVLMMLQGLYEASGNDETDDGGDYYGGDDAGYDTEGADYATADGADWQQ